MHRGEILGWGALADLIMLAVVVGILARRAWVSVSALALERRGYDQNHAARQRAADLIADGYHGFLSGHTHHPELGTIAAGFYANSGSCTSVVEGIGGRFGLPPAYVRNQQVCWVEMSEDTVRLVTARVELPGRDQDGAVRRAGPQPALGHAGLRRLLAGRARLARAGQEGRQEEARASGRARALDGAAAGLRARFPARASRWPRPRIRMITKEFVPFPGIRSFAIMKIRTPIRIRGFVSCARPPGPPRW